ncbi:MAG: hypothetical protein RLY97_647, partial [Pseudomonadota bacterium]
PIFAHYWGLGDYGVWLILFTVPSMLTMADLGLTVAAGNSMTMSVAHGDVVKAARIYVSLRFAMILVSCVILAGAAIFLRWLRPEILDFAQSAAGGHAFAATMMLLAYGCLGLQNGISVAGFRAADAAAYIIFLVPTMALAEVIVALGIVIFGGKLLMVAGSFLIMRVGISAFFEREVGRLGPWVRENGWKPDFGELRVLMGPALAALVLVVANVVALQGAVMAVGACLGPVAVPVFTTVRTMTRTLMQFCARLNYASVTPFTVAVAKGDERRKAQLFLANILVSFGVLLPLSPVVVFLGQPVVQLWTGGMVQPSFYLMLWMVVAMVGNGIWMPLSNLIMATNRHASFSYFYLVCAVLGIALGVVVAPKWGIEGLSAALAMSEVVMVLWIGQLVVRMGIFQPSELREAMRELVGWVKMRVGLGA